MKYSVEGIKIPLRCKFCGSRKTILSTYADNRNYIECFACFQVIKEILLDSFADRIDQAEHILSER
jgi:DNA-directed RNA polymerase subunit N (RpoN/RPB10)